MEQVDKVRWLYRGWEHMKIQREEGDKLLSDLEGIWGIEKKKRLSWGSECCVPQRQVASVVKASELATCSFAQAFKIETNKQKSKSLHDPR